jgi:hypothetical protein
MMKVKKISTPATMSIEDAVNDFFQRENISKHDIVHIRPVHMNHSNGINDVVAVYVFYDKHEEGKNV